MTCVGTRGGGEAHVGIRECPEQVRPAQKKRVFTTGTFGKAKTPRGGHNWARRMSAPDQQLAEQGESTA